MRMRYFIGIDSSTTATKALLIDETGDQVAVAAATYSFDTPNPLWSEQAPSLWWEGTQKAVRQVIAESGVAPLDIHGVGLTGQMHGLVLLDEQGAVLRPAILWNDQRTQAQCDEIRRAVGKDLLIATTGNDALTGFTAPKILWVREHEPDIYARIRHILLPKDYVRFQLTGRYATDKAGGSGTILFDLRQRDWSDSLVARLGIQHEWLPPTFEGTAQTGLVSEAAAQATGLAAGTPVYGGGGDQAASAVGTGAVSDGIVSISLGTSGVVFAATSTPVVEPDGRLHAFCHAVPDRWHLMGVMLSAAGSLRWFHDTFIPDQSYEALNVDAAAVPAGANGLLFLPYLTGERTPHPDPLARGAFIGLTVSHTRTHLYRAVMEGVAFGLRDSFELMDRTGLADVTEVRVTGGGARSALWRQILADVLQIEVVTINASEGAAFGAALLAATGAGCFQTVDEACRQVIRETARTKPSADAAAYDRLYSLYQTLYPLLADTFHQLP